MAVPREFRGIDVTLPTRQEVENLESLLDKNIERKSSARCRGYRATSRNTLPRRTTRGPEERTAKS
jgi:hypothetical protein